MVLIYLTLGVAPCAFVLLLNMICSGEFQHKRTAAIVSFAISGLFFLVNHLVNTNRVDGSHGLHDVGEFLSTFAVNILWLTWPGIVWLVFDLFAKLKFNLYLLGLLSTHFPVWIAVAMLMNSNPEDALGWIIVPFLQAYMFLASLIIYYLAKKVFEKRPKAVATIYKG